MLTNPFLTNKSFSISQVEKQHLVDAYRRGENYLYLSRQLEIFTDTRRMDASMLATVAATRAIITNEVRNEDPSIPR